MLSFFNLNLIMVNIKWKQLKIVTLNKSIFNKLKLKFVKYTRTQTNLESVHKPVEN